MTNTSPKTNFDNFLDARGLNCPLPVLKAKLELNRMEPGQILCVEATDPHSVIDFKAYCARSGHEIIQLIESEEVFTFYIRHNQLKK